MKIIKQALNPAFLKLMPHKEEIDFFKKEMGALLDRINPKENEEYHKNLIKDFLNADYYKDKHYINTRGKVDLVIHNINLFLTPTDYDLKAKICAQSVPLKDVLGIAYI